MVESKETEPTLLVFDKSNIESYTAAAYQATRDAQWRFMVFDNVEYALDELDNSINALAITIGPRASITRSVFPGHELIELSDELQIPRALISRNTAARWLLRREMPDILLNVEYESEVVRLPGRIAKWLSKLTVGNAVEK